jgi:hypothetical protein
MLWNINSCSCNFLNEIFIWKTICFELMGLVTCRIKTDLGMSAKCYCNNYYTRDHISLD